MARLTKELRALVLDECFGVTHISKDWIGRYEDELGIVEAERDAALALLRKVYDRLDDISCHSCYTEGSTAFIVGATWIPEMMAEIEAILPNEALGGDDGNAS